MSSSRRHLAVLAAAGALLAVPGAAAASEPCDAPASPAGEWTTYGADLANSRTQPLETAIGTANAAALAPAFVFEAPGLINGTPLVSGGCVFVSSQGATTSVGRVTAIDADDGALRWKTDVPVGTAAFGGPQVGSPALAGDVVITAFSRQGAPFVVGLDRDTGAERWRTVVDEGQEFSGINASPVVYDGMVFVGFFGNADAQAHERGGFVLLDAATGALIKKTYVIPQDDFDAGYAGAGIWATAAVDPETGYAYVGTSNPHNARMEHPLSDSILKIDLDRDRATFGEIVGSYKGVSDTLVPGAADQPVCDAKEDVYYAYSFSATCLAVDLDFGASPNLFRDAAGKLRVGELQKAGIYHIVDATEMTGLAKVPVGAPCFSCNAASSAFADGTAFVAGGPPGELVAASGESGTPAWAAPIGGGFTYNPVSVANGVVWTVDSGGFLDGYDQATGVPLVKRSLEDDTGVRMIEATTSAGIAIAHNTLYTAATTFVVALRPTT